MPLERTSTRVTPGDLSGGFASAVVSIPGNVAAGVIAFAPLGPEYAGRGILAGMLSSIVAGLLASLFGGAPGMIAGPKATTSMAFAAMLASLLATGHFDLATPDGERLVLSMAYGAVLISGSVQILLGAFRVGGLVKFMPYPVVAGIRNTTAILLISSQLWPSLGVSRQSWGDLLRDPGQIQPATLAVAAFTAWMVWKGSRWFRKPAVPIVALVTGSLLYHLIHAAIPQVRLGPLLGTLPSAIPRPEYLASVFGALADSVSLGVLAAVLSGALAIAVLDSISALITLVSYQSIADRRFDANNQLVGQGIGSAVSAFFGGLTTSGILARAVVNYRAGGRSRASGVVNALGVLVLMLALTRPLALLPKAAIAGLIMVIAAGLFDRWSFGQVMESLRPDAQDRRDNLVATVQMTFVVLVGVVWSLVAAVGAGVALSVLFFVAQMSRSPIRRIRTGATVRSAKTRDRKTTGILEEKGHRIAVLELEGTIFFGSSDALATQAEELADEGADFVIFDMKRVRDVDATGFKVLGQTFARLRGRGTTLGFSYVTPGVLRSEIAEDLMLNGVPEARMFESTDRALEYFEDGLLMKLGADEFDEEGWTLEMFGADWGLAPAESEILRRYVSERTLDGGDFLFNEGDTDRSLFMLRRGSADISIPIPGEARRRRLGTVTKGTVIGEISLLDGLPRSAGVKATGPLTAYQLAYDDFLRLAAEYPGIAVKIQAGVGGVMGARLRRANALIAELDS
jgi:MFS superfamily sulfate permease-like transporter/CRP-like cAMP-binding protein